MLEALPRNGIANFRDQLARSATSVGANYAEVCAPESRRDFASKMAKALKEAKESRMWLFIISRRGYFAESRMKPLLDEANSIISTPGPLTIRPCGRGGEFGIMPPVLPPCGGDDV